VIAHAMALHRDALRVSLLIRRLQVRVLPWST
jgi:hypothetical protein